MRTRFEIKMKVPIFGSRAWMLRSAAIQAGIKKQRKWLGSSTWFANPVLPSEGKGNWFSKLMRKIQRPAF